MHTSDLCNVRTRVKQRTQTCTGFAEDFTHPTPTFPCCQALCDLVPPQREEGSGKDGGQLKPQDGIKPSAGYKERK